MVTRKTWEEFRESGFIFWINQILHTFGWAIVIEVDEEGKISECYPARVKFRGFGNQQIIDGYIKVSKYMLDNAQEIYEESCE